MKTHIFNQCIRKDNQMHTIAFPINPSIIFYQIVFFIVTSKFCSRCQYRGIRWHFVLIFLLLPTVIYLHWSSFNYFKILNKRIYDSLFCSLLQLHINIFLYFNLWNSWKKKHILWKNNCKNWFFYSLFLFLN